MTHTAWVMQSTCGRGLWLVDGYMVYTDIDLEYHSHHSTIFKPTVDKPIILTYSRRID